MVPKHSLYLNFSFPTSLFCRQDTYLYATSRRFLTSHSLFERPERSVGIFSRSTMIFCCIEAGQNYTFLPLTSVIRIRNLVSTLVSLSLLPSIVAASRMYSAEIPKRIMFNVDLPESRFLPILARYLSKSDIGSTLGNTKDVSCFDLSTAKELALLFRLGIRIAWTSIPTFVIARHSKVSLFYVPKRVLHEPDRDYSAL